jgi:hypothetical protein
MDKELILNEYKTKIEALTNGYLKKLISEIPEENRNIERAREFLSKYYDEYRRAVARIGVDMLHNHDLSEEAKQVVLEKNGSAIAKLFTEVANLSLGSKYFGTDL